MKRLLAAALFAAAAVAALPAWAAGLPASLRGTAVIEGDTIRLGDLWDNLEDKADTVVANAPQPGKRATLDARWLAAVANAYGLDWRPASASERIVVERVGRTIDPNLIETEIREALAMEGAPASAGIEIANRAGLSIVVPVGTPATVAVKDVVYDARMGRFAANVEVPANQPAVARLRVTGRVYSTTRVPVLNRLVNRGDRITERDIDWQDLRQDTVRGDVITDPGDLIGLEPRYQVRAGVPVRRTDVQRPVAVAKNSSVTMILETPFMKLTTRGKAVEDGSQGDVIRVTNIHTKQTVEATVRGPGLVAVQPGGPRVLAN